MRCNWFVWLRMTINIRKKFGRSFNPLSMFSLGLVESISLFLIIGKIRINAEITTPMNELYFDNGGSGDECCNYKSFFNYFAKRHKCRNANS